VLNCFPLELDHSLLSFLTLLTLTLEVLHKTLCFYKFLKFLRNSIELPLTKQVKEFLMFAPDLAETSR
jgi:hypothetical protein